MPLLERGGTLEFDLIGKSEYPLQLTMELVADLIGKGLGHRILLSHDIFTKFNLQAFGGEGLVGIDLWPFPSFKD